MVIYTADLALLYMICDLGTLLSVLTSLQCFGLYLTMARCSLIWAHQFFPIFIFSETRNC